MAQGGYVIKVTITTMTGYNAMISQDAMVTIYFKTSNGSSVDGNGFAGDSNYWVDISNNAGVYTVKWKANAAGGSATAYDLYVYFGSYTGQSSFYTVEYDASNVTWTNVMGTGQTDPGVGSTTVCIATYQKSWYANYTGINTASPTYTLDVNGTFRASGATSLASVSINSAGQLVPTGAGGVATNTAVGQYAMSANTNGNENTAVGTSAMQTNTTGNYNTAVGQAAMSSNTTGVQNTAVGAQAMYNNTTGQNNVCLGVSSGSDALVSITTQSNYVVLGNNSTATLYCKTSTINTSDARDKTNVESIAVGLDYVRKLKPVTFNFDDRGWYPEGQAPDGSKACSIHRLGFLAQDILAAEQELGLPFNHVVNTDFPEKLGIAPTNLIPILVKAIQELEQSLATATANISSLQPPSAPANPQSSP